MTNMVEIGLLQPVADGTMATNIRKKGSKTQVAIDERVQPIVVDVVSKDPNVAAAAAVQAGTLAASELELVQGQSVVGPNSTASVSWTLRQPTATVPALVTATVQQTGVATTPVDASVVVVDPITGKVSESVLPEGLKADDAGIANVLKTPTGESARLLIRQFGGRLLMTDPDVGGVGGPGNDNTAAFNRAMTNLGATGGELVIPPGPAFDIYGTTLPVPGGVTISSTGIPYADPATPIQRHGILRAAAPMARLIELGANPDSSAATDTSAALRDIFVDGRELADYTVVTSGRRWEVDHAQIYWGKLAGLLVEGQNGAFQGWSIVSQNNAGSCVIVRNQPDNKFFSGQLRQPGVDGACLLIEPTGSTQQGQGDILVQALHMWTGQNGIPTVGALIKLRATSSRSIGGVHIIACQLEGCLGDQVQLIAEGAGSVIRNIMLASNNIFQNSLISDGSKSILSMTGPGTIADILYSPSMAYAPRADKRWRSVFHDYGTGPRSRIQMLGVAARRTKAFWTRDAGSVWTGPELATMVGLSGDGEELRNRYADKTTLTGADGTKTTFSVVNGLSFNEARSVNVTPLSSAAARPHFATYGGGELTVTFDTAPPAGADLRLSYDLWQ